MVRSTRILVLVHSFEDFENLKKPFHKEKNIFEKSKVVGWTVPIKEIFFDRRLKIWLYILMEDETKGKLVYCHSA
jgi:hypothetical protein